MEGVGPKMDKSPWRKFLVYGPQRTENQRNFLDYGPQRTENQRNFLDYGPQRTEEEEMV